MKAEDQKAPAQADPADSTDPEAPPRRSYARQIDCGGPEAKQGAAAEPLQSGRGTGRLRNPPEDH